MSEAYTLARTEMIQEQEQPPQARQEEDVPILFLQDVERQYRQGDETLHVLNGVELALWPGQSVALVAPSGAGKSTLLHVAGLLEHPDHGDVYIDGRSTSILADHDRTRIRRNEIGFVYQSHHLLPEFSALENVMLPQMIRGLTRTEAKTRGAELLEYLGLGGRLDHRPDLQEGVRDLRRRLQDVEVQGPRVELLPRRGNPPLSDPRRAHQDRIALLRARPRLLVAVVD